MRHIPSASPALLWIKILKNAILVAALLGLAACGGGGDGTVVLQDNGGDVPPLTAYTSFSDNRDGTVTDWATGLVWLMDGNCYGWGMPWQNAMDSAKLLAHNQCGLNDHSKAGDWRLPTLDELSSFASATRALGTPFFVNVQAWYWTSDTYYNTNRAYEVSLRFPYGWTWTDKLDNKFVWPVRSGSN